MAREVISFAVDITVQEAIQQTGSLKQAIREAEKQATALAEQFGATSIQAINAAKNTAKLREALSDVKQTIDALNPEAKFKAIGQVASGIAGGFSAAQGAMALFGSESKDLEKTLLKVQGAMALSQGINELRGLGDALTNIKIVANDAASNISRWWKALEGATVAEKLMTASTLTLTAALSALPFVIIGVLVAGLIKIWSDYSDEQDKIAKAEKDRHEAAVKSLKERVEKSLEITRQTEGKRLELIQDARQKELALEKFAYENKVRDLTAMNLTTKAFQEAAIAEQLLHTQKLSAINKKFDEQEAKDRLDRQKKANEEFVKEAKKNLDTIEKDRKYSGNNIVKIKVETDHSIVQSDNQATAGQLNNSKIIAKENKDQANERQQVAVALADRLGAIDSIVLQAEQRRLQEGGAANIEAAKKLFAIHKALAVASIAVSTAKAITKDISEFPYPYNLVVAGIDAAIGTAQTAIVLSQEFNPGNTTSSGSASLPKAQAPNTSSGVNTRSNSTTRLDSNSINNAPPGSVIRAVVVETDITQSQRRVNRIQNQANLGG